MVSEIDNGGTSAFDSSKLKFPLKWHGRLVTLASAGDVSQNVRDVYGSMGLSEGTVAPGNASAKGKYCSWQLSCQVHSLEELRTLFRELEGIPGVRMLI